MINFDAFVTYLEDRRKNIAFFIKQNELISIEEIEKLRILYKEYDKYELDNCFEKTELKGSTFLVEAKCERCKLVIKKEIPKTKLIEYLKEGKKQFRYEHICKDCKNREEENEKKERIEYWKNREEDKNKNTIIFIKELFNNESKWSKDNDNYYNKIFYAEVDDEKIESYIKEEYSTKAKYQLFLQTPYWRHIAHEKRKKEGFKCELCGSNESLNVHHKNNYEDFGKEKRNIKKLVLLCHECHQKQHNILVFE